MDDVDHFQCSTSTCCFLNLDFHLYNSAWFPLLYSLCTCMLSLMGTEVILQHLCISVYSELELTREPSFLFPTVAVFPDMEILRGLTSGLKFLWQPKYESWIAKWQSPQNHASLPSHFPGDACASFWDCYTPDLWMLLRQSWLSELRQVLHFYHRSPPDCKCSCCWICL